MPLSAPAPRTLKHTRAIECKGYEREDGLWDIEGHLVDTKTYAFSNNERGEIEPGVPVHEMRIRLTIDDTFEIRAVEAVTEHSPFSVCREIAPNFERLVGLTIGAGWRRAVAARVGGVEGCTHIVELLGPVATTAFQTIMPLRERERAKRQREAGSAAKTGERKRPRLLNTCHAFREDGPKTKEFWPDFYTGT
ncbi:MAG: DUF2889 domain-containing protein [Alphaproteobacteria bacterium]